MGTALLALCFCALSLVLALFVGISPISDKAKARFMYVSYKNPTIHSTQHPQTFVFTCIFN